MSALDEKLSRLNEKRARLLEQEKALKAEMRQIEAKKKQVARKNRNRDLILFGTEFFRKGRLDYETDYKAFVAFLNENEWVDELIADFKAKGGGSNEQSDSEN